MTAMGGTGVIFLGLSGYALTTRKDFSFMGGFLMVGILIAFMAGLILYETSNIIHGGETNYIMATVTLFAPIFNLFTSLLHLLGAFSSNE